MTPQAKLDTCRLKGGSRCIAEPLQRLHSLAADLAAGDTRT